MKWIFLLLFPTFSNASTNITGMVQVYANNATHQVLAENPKRSYLLIQNNGSIPIYVKFGVSQTSNTDGILLPAGGNYEPINPIRNSIFAIAASGSQSIVILQGE